jgi:DNA-binding LytR/AlgR family response regulator
VAEDEASVREVLAAQLGQFLPDATIEEAGDGFEALAKATSGNFDVVFLDIEMPGLSGLEVASRLLGLKKPPRIVFATGKAGHAIEAFRLAAFDYVVKPFEPDRLQQTVERLLADGDSTVRQRESIGRVFEHQEIPKVWAEIAEESWALVDHAEIYWIQADGRTITLHGPRLQAPKVKQPLKELEAKLSQFGFLRVHKGYLVNTSRVSGMRGWFSGSYILEMSDPASTEIPLSRRYAVEFKKATGWH